MFRRSLLALFCIEILGLTAVRGTRAEPLVFGPELGVDQPVSTPLTNTHSAKVAFDGTNHLVVWSDPRGGVRSDDPDSSIFAARVTAGGTLLDPTGICISDGTGIIQDQTGLAKGHPAIAFDGTNYLVVWMDARSGAQVYGARVTPAGQVLDTQGFRISTDPIDPTEAPAAPSGQEDPAVVFDGTQFVVAWSDGRGSLISGRDIYAAHVTTQGTVIEAGGFVVTDAPGDQALPLVASAGGGQSLVTWTTGGLPTGVFAARVSADGAVLDTPPIVLSTSRVEAHVLYPRRAVAADPSGYLSLWCVSDPEVARCDLTATKIDNAGNVGAPAVVAAGILDSLLLAAEYDGQRFTVLWSGEVGQTSMMRIAVDGALLDGSGGLLVSGLPWPADTAFGGGRFLVVGRAPYVDNLVAATLEISAAPTTGPMVAVAVAPTNVESIPAAVFDGSGYLVTWLDNRSSIGAIMGARLDGNGVTRDPNALTVYDGSPLLTSVPFPMASDGHGFMVGWREVGTTVMARAVTGDGVTDPVTSIANSDPYAPPNIALGFGGTAYSIFWSEMASPVRASIRGARLSTTGALLGQVMITSGLPSTKPAVACAPNRCLLAFTEAPTNGPSPSYSGPGAIRGVFVDDALAKGAFFTIASGTNDPQDLPQVAFDGTNWLVTWQDAARRTLRGARVDTNANVLDSSPLVIAQSQTLDALRPATLTFDGTDYLLAWESGGIRLARITTAGTVLDPGGVAGPPGARPALAGRLLAYSQPASGRSRVFVRLRVPAAIPDGGVDGPPADGGVTPADGGVDSAPSDTSGENDAGMDAEQPGADASVDAMAPDGGRDGKPPRPHWPPFGRGCSVADADSTLASWAGLLFALLVARTRRNQRAGRRE